jgi:hypothetical protein
MTWKFVDLRWILAVMLTSGTLPRCFALRLAEMFHFVQHDNEWH